MNKSWKVIRRKQIESIFLSFKNKNKEVAFFSIMSFIIKKNYEETKRLYFINETNISLFDFVKLIILYKKAMNTPWQYILKKCYFMGNIYFIKKGVFIPRNETEIIINELCKINNQLSSDLLHDKRIIEFGSGSGAIISEAANIFGASWKYFAVDISKHALFCSKKNFPFKANIKLIRNDWTKNLLFEDKFTIIISNPPYVARKEYIGKISDPKLSTLGNKKKYINYYKEIIEFAEIHLTKNGYLIFELNPFSISEINKIINRKKFTKTFVKDYTNVYRFLILKKLNNS